LHASEDRALVRLRSLVCPGFEFVCNTAEDSATCAVYGGLYFGNGLFIQDTSFLGL
jgi:hypothetical protein